MDKVRVAAVSYLNTLPFIYGIKNSNILNDIQLSLEIPSVCASKLINNEVDIGLVPVAVLPELSYYEIITDFCIGSNQKVDSVMLYSERPIREVKRILLDYQSRTSAMLTKVLARNHWKIAPEWVAASPGYEQKIKGDTAGLVIGDRTFDLNGQFPYQLDLAAEWYAYSRLPFVFAAWVSNKKLPSKFVHNFQKALQFGVENMSKAVESAGKKASSRQLENYLTHSISYSIDTQKRKGLDRFLKEIKLLKKVNYNNC